jgi:hypothetical protein
MKANRKSNRTVTIALSIAAVGLLAFGSVGGARAAITNYSDAYVAEFETQEIGVALTENGNPVEGDDALLQDAGKMTPGKTVTDALAATNDGTIDEYIRLTVRKYWIDESKRLDLKPNMIQLVQGSDKWIMVDENENDEFVEFYYTEPVAPGDATSDAITGFIVDNSITTFVSQTTSDDGHTITTTYEYNGLSVGLEAEVDGVQTHNAHDAILSAWGVDATMSGDTITAIN